MNLQELKQALINQTECEPENITLGSDKQGDYIAIDEFKVRAEDDGLFSVEDSNDTFETFATTPENVLEYFKGFYDAYIDDTKDKSKANEYYDIGFEFGIESQEDEDDEEEEDEEDDSQQFEA